MARSPRRSSDNRHPAPTERPDDRILIGVSACLLGDEVRYDGGHKRDRYVTDTLGAFFRFAPVCPEMELGLGVPRETLRLVRVGRDIRLKAPGSGADHTSAMRSYAETRVRGLGRLGIRGYILKKDSPSCGMTRVKTYTGKGLPAPSDRGLFTDALLRTLPLLPVEEEGRLKDPLFRESFIVRVFAYDRLERLFTGRWQIRSLVAFHAAEKMLIMAHDPDAQKRLGRIVATAKGTERQALRSAYSDAFMRALARPATSRKHVNVLQHMAGYFRDQLGTEARRDIASAIDDYGHGITSLIVPVMLIRHYVTLLDIHYLRGQTYLSPHPNELALRNHV